MDIFKRFLTETQGALIMSSLATIQAAVAEAQALAVVEKELEAAARKEAADKITALQTQVDGLESQISGLQVQLSNGTALSNVDIESLLSQIDTLGTAITDISPAAPVDPTALAPAPAAAPPSV